MITRIASTAGVQQDDDDGGCSRNAHTGDMQHNPSRPSDTHLSGNWLHFARLAFLGVSFAAHRGLGHIVGIPVRLRLACARSVPYYLWCAAAHAVQNSAIALQQMDLSITFYANVYIGTIQVLFITGLCGDSPR